MTDDRLSNKKLLTLIERLTTRDISVCDEFEDDLWIGIDAIHELIDARAEIARLREALQAFVSCKRDGVGWVISAGEASEYAGRNLYAAFDKAVQALAAEQQGGARPAHQQGRKT